MNKTIIIRGKRRSLRSCSPAVFKRDGEKLKDRICGDETIPVSDVARYIASAAPETGANVDDEAPFQLWTRTGFASPCAYVGS